VDFVTAAVSGASDVRRFMGVVAMALFALTLVVVPGTSAIPSPMYVASTTPVQAGANATVTITNCGASVPGCPDASSVNLGSATISVSGFTPTAPSITGPNPHGWTASVVSGVIKLKAPSVALPDQRLAPGEGISVQFAAPTSTASSPYPLTTNAYSSDDFATGPLNRQGSDPQLTVTPGPLDHFTLGAPSPSPVVAGTAETASVTAKDQYENTITDYATSGNPAAGVDAQASSTMSGTPNGCPSYNAASPNPCPVPTVSLSSFVAGVATASFTPVRAESAHLTVSDTSPPQQATSDGADFTVTPAALDHFVLGAPSPSPVAGEQSSIAVVAYDQFGNKKTNYNSTANVTHTLGTSDAGCPGGCAPLVPTTRSFSGGDATLNFTAYKAQASRSITITDPCSPTSNCSTSGTHNGSVSFTVEPNVPDKLTFAQQPTETQVGNTCGPAQNMPCKITPAVKVRVLDQYGNRVYGASVTMTIGVDPDCPTSCATLSGALSQTTLGVATDPDTDPKGVATFNDLTISRVQYGYKLRATSGAASQLSSVFNIVDKVYACPGSCTNRTTTIPQNTTVSVDGAQTNALTTLGLSLILSGANTTPPQGLPEVCRVNGVSFVPAAGAPTSFVDINVTGTVGQLLTVTWTLDKSIVNKLANNGAAHYRLCAGALYLGAGTPTPWKTLDGSNAIARHNDAFDVDLYWGVLPDCPSTSGKKKPALSGPCTISKTKDPAGNVLYKYALPYPWDLIAFLSP
jgi:hypothetical protein